MAIDWNDDAQYNDDHESEDEGVTDEELEAMGICPMCESSVCICNQNEQESIFREMAN